MDLSPLAYDPTKLTELSFSIQISDAEYDTIKAATPALALMYLQTQLARNEEDNALRFTQYLSTQEGQKRLTEARTEVEKLVAAAGSGSALNLTLQMNAGLGELRGVDFTSQMFLSVLDRGLPAHLSYFNFFPADRALPQGEVAIQLGAADVQQQLQSYIAMPALKYARLKQVIIRAILFDQGSRQQLVDYFNLIFDNLLPGKKLVSINFNEFSTIRVLVKDEKSGKVFDIDSMSSGEKGLVLTFLLMKTSAASGSIVFLDEPELHLNSAVCGRILPFIAEHCVKALDAQVFICTHSPEIVRDAYERDDCSLFHLRSGSDLTPVLRQDVDEVFEILSRLGNSPADILFSRGNVFVEGDDDIAILQAGYGALLNGYKMTAVGGRAEIEKEVPNLQAQETEGKLVKKQLFIFDRDRSISNIQSSPLVKIEQLRRYCIENYLLDENLLYDAVKAHAKEEAPSRGSFPSDLEAIALKQLTEVIIKEVYEQRQPMGAGLRTKDAKGVTFEEAARALAERLRQLKTFVEATDFGTWEADFVRACNDKFAELEPAWKSSWRELASGKRIIDDLYIKYTIQMKKIEFKRLIMNRMASDKTDDWRILDQILAAHLT